MDWFPELSYAISGTSFYVKIPYCVCDFGKGFTCKKKRYFSYAWREFLESDTYIVFLRTLPLTINLFILEKVDCL